MPKNHSPFARALDRLLFWAASFVRRIPIERGKMPLLRNPLARALIAKGYLTDHKFPGRHGIVWDASTLPDMMTAHMLLYGSYQEDVLDCFRRYLKPGEVAFDVGAH